MSISRLSNFEMKLFELDSGTFFMVKSLLMNIPNLQQIKFEINLGFIEKDPMNIDYLNGTEWHAIRTQHVHLLDFDCTLSCQLRSRADNNPCQQIIASFSKYSYWSVHVCESNTNATYICIYTKSPKMIDSNIEINHSILRKLNGNEIATLIDSVSSLYIYTVSPLDDSEDEIASLPLVLPDRLFSRLNNLNIWADCYMCFNDRLESFLKQLFAQTPNVRFIQISTHGSGDDYDDISRVLDCFEKPSMSITSCMFYVKACYDEYRIEEVISHLPMLTSLEIDIIYETEELIDIVNTCLIHAKYLLYLNLSLPVRESPNVICLSREKAYPTYPTKDNITLWLEQNTLLGDSRVGRDFNARCCGKVEIWL